METINFTVNNRPSSRSGNGGAALLSVLGGAFVAAQVARQIARRARRIEFANKTALITGGSRGLGLILARMLHAQGARVAICGRDASDLAEAKAQIERGVAGQGSNSDVAGASSSRVLAVACDVTRDEDVINAVASAQRAFGAIDILINNAGMIGVGPLETQTREDFEEAMQTNFWGAYRFVEAVLPTMRAQKSGRIANISSIGGKVSVPHMLPYSTSKFALVGYSEGLRAELLPQNIHVTTVCPGLIRTGSPKNALFKGQHRAEYQWFALSDSLPGLSYSADGAAREILDALRHGDAELLISLPTRLAALANGAAPNLVADAMALANRLLPTADGGLAGENIGTERRTGAQSETPLTQGVLTTLTQRAEIANNQR